MRRYVVDRGRLDRNIRAVTETAGNAAVYGILKGDGYGLGLAPMAEALAAGGITHFAVTEAADAILLAGMDIPAEEILLLRPATAEELEPLLALGCVTFSLGSAGEAEVLVRAARRLDVRPRAHIQIDTGLGRYGVRWDEPETLRLLYENFPAIRFTGIYTHFACPERVRMTRQQFRRFQTALEALDAAGIHPGTRHCCNSTAMLRYPEMRLDAVRVGSGVVGRVPGGEAAGLFPAGWCETAVEAVRELPAGTTVGYGAKFRTRRDTRAAVVSVGAIHGLGAGAAHGRQGLYAGLMGLFRSFRDILRGGSGLTGELNGTRVPVLGEICSECAVLDVTGLPCVPGDVVRFSLNPLYCQGMERVWKGGTGEASPAAGSSV